MGFISKQMMRYSHLLSGVLILAILLFSAAGANAGSVITLCNDCHGMPPKDAARKGNPHFRSNSSATVGSHQKHLVVSPVANDCVVCHGTLITATGHQNDVINMASSISGGTYGKGLFFNQTSIPLLNATATCSNVTCHANVYGAGTISTPVWGVAAANCTACHSTPIATTGPATGSHAIHNRTDCSQCHTGATTSTAVPTLNHADGDIDVNSGYPANVAKHTTASGFGGRTCSTASCHANVYGTGSVTTPVWGATGGCSSCHTTPIGATGPATGSHVKHNNTDCSQCHTGATTSTAVPTLNHADGDIDVNSGYPANVVKHTTASGFGGRTCSTASCHANVYGTGSVTTPVWGAAGGCSSCHTTPIGATGPATGSHAIHANPSCIACHNAGTTATTVPSTGHADGNIDVTNGYPLNVVKHAAGTYTGTCSASTCHGQGAPTWGATSTSPVNGFPYSASQCGKCHSQEGTVTAGAPFYSTAIPKVTLNTNAKVGAHTAHLTSVDLHPALACSDCHGTGYSHMNGTTDFNWSALAKTGNLTPLYNPATGACSSVYCHGNAMPGGDTSGSNKTPVWNSTTYLPSSLSVAACGTCHGFPPPISAGHPAVTLPAGFPLTAPIGTTCNCHGNVNPAGNSYSNIFVNSAQHINGTLEGGKCDTCHGYPPASVGFTGTQNNWSSARTENYPGGGGAHTINNHVSKNANPNDGFAYCIKCHEPADHATSPTVFTPSTNIKVTINKRYRLEATKQVRYTSNRLDGAAHLTGTCSNISCHYGATPKWDPSH